MLNHLLEDRISSSMMISDCNASTNSRFAKCYPLRASVHRDASGDSNNFHDDGCGECLALSTFLYVWYSVTDGL